MVDNIGMRLRHVRRAKGITLAELAEKTGMSIGFLSNLERDMSSPTLENLWNICEALGVSLIKLLEETKNDGIIVRKSEREVIFEQKDAMKYETINFGEEKMEGIMITLSPKCESEKGWRHTYDELGLVIQGEMTVFLEDEEYLLHEGDAIYVESNRLHSICNRTDAPCLSYWVKETYDHDVDQKVKRKK